MSDHSPIALDGDDRENISPEDSKPFGWDPLREKYQQEINNIKLDIASIHVDVNVTLLGFRDDLKKENSINLNKETEKLKNTLSSMINCLRIKVDKLDQELGRIREITEGQQRIFKDFEATIEASREMVVQLRSLGAIAAEAQLANGNGNSGSFNDSDGPGSPLLEQKRKKREKVQVECPNCGKSMQNGSLTRHLKLSCSGSIPGRMNCQHCGKNLSVNYISRHIATACSKVAR